MVSVYLIRAGKTDNYKIGISNNVKNRLGTLQTGHYERLSIIHTLLCDNRFIALAVEEDLHNTYKSFNTMGEWFRLTNNQVENIKKVFDTKVSEIIILKARIKALEIQLDKLSNISNPTKITPHKQQSIKSGLLGSVEINMNTQNSYKRLIEKILSSVNYKGKIAPKKNLINPNIRQEARDYERAIKELLSDNKIYFVNGKGYYLNEAGGM